MALTPEQQGIADQIIDAIVDKAPAFIQMGRRGGKTAILAYVDAQVEQRREELLERFEALRIEQARERGRMQRIENEHYENSWKDGL